MIKSIFEDCISSAHLNCCVSIFRLSKHEESRFFNWARLLFDVVSLRIYVFLFTKSL